MSESDFVERMVAAMRRSGVTQADLARELGLPSQSAVSNILHGKRQVKVDEAAKISAILGMVPAPNISSVPIVGIASAGNWREAIEMPQGIMPIPNGVAGKRSFAVEVSGDSMDKLIRDGGFIVVDPDKASLFNGKCYLVSNGDGEATVKMYRSDPARLEPMSTNPEHQSIPLGERHFHVIGRVVWCGSPV